jgi:hypothetical protein
MMVDFAAEQNGAAPANDTAPPLYVIESAKEIAKPLPPLVWLCEGLRVARGSLTIVGGYGYSRKTLFAQELALSIATGTPALGVYRTTQAPVLHIDNEQGQRITRERYQRLACARGIDLRDAQLSVVTFPDFRLSDAIARDTMRRLLEETHAGYIVIDSVRASVAGVDENSSQMREYLDLVGQEVKRVDGAAEVLHHARKPAEGKTGGKYSLRGSSAIFDAADGIFIFTAEKGEPTTVEHEKDRLVGTELDSFGLDSEDVSRDGDPRWGLRLVHLEGEQLAQRASEAESEAVDGTIRRVRAFLKQNGGTFAGSRKDLCAAVGMSERGFSPAFARMKASNELANEGKYHEPLWRWTAPAND